MSEVLNIPDGWVETTLGNSINLIGGGTPNTSTPEYWGGEIPWLSVVDFNDDNRWVYSAEKSITELGLKKSATKLMAEKLTINANNFYIKRNFYCIRFGNIIGSRGSVLEIFKKQLYKGSNLTVTSSEMTRFFMDMNEAALGVLSSLNISRGGEIFIIKSMQAFKIVDLAKALISSLKNKSKIIYIGKKPGEKLHEELLTAEESKNAIENKKFIIINESYSYSDNIKFYLGKKLKNFNLLSSSTVKLLNKNEILEYLKKKINTN
jgi:FlaA1/EpsC-like NDP-sugar epimerase